MSEDQRRAVSVHIASSDVPLGGGGARQAVTSYRPNFRTVYQTVTLTADDPCQPILPASDARDSAFLFVLDQTIVISGRQSDAAAGTGATILQGAGGWIVFDRGAVYAACLSLTGTETARVTVQALYDDK
jgi:hypothetical protein